MAFVRLAAGDITADDEFLEALVALKLDTLVGVFSYSGEGFLRTHANRDNFHLMREVGGRAYDFFMKRHRGFEIKEALKLLAADRPFSTAARREWENILRLEAHGIPTMRPVAFGESQWLFLERRSFIITERIANARPMDEYLSEHPSRDLAGEKLREARSLLWDAGDLVRRLHTAGLTHMDLYLNHFFVRETPDGEKTLHIIDLQRVAKRRLFKKRWIIKDLAALLYSTRNSPLSRTDVARIFTAYFDGSMSLENRALFRAALARCRRMMGRRS